ncbi:hypothetical protein MOKP118_19210 [Mycobacterium avium subsp. hominissuis]
MASDSGPQTPAATAHAATARASPAAVYRVARASTNAVSAAGSARPGLSGSNRGRRQAKATRAKVKVSAHAAPTIA